MKQFILALGLGVLLFASGANAQAVTAAITESRASGAAPFAVFFDATSPYMVGDNVGDEFHEYTYTWDFDDPTSGTWSISGDSKDVALGPVAAHVFDADGIYIVGLTVTDWLGNSDTDTIEITVTDPDTVYTGAATTCISNDADFTGCPAGSTEVTSSSFATAISSYGQTDDRVLFKRDDTFSGTGAYGAGPGIIGAFGTGADPIINGKLSNQNLSSGWVFMDLKLVGGGAAEGIYGGRAQDDILLYGLDVSDSVQGVSILHSFIDFRIAQGETTLVIHDGLFIVDCVIDADDYDIYASAERLAIMGNDLKAVDLHNIRSRYSTPGVFQHNQVVDQGSGNSLLKLHAGNWLQPTTSTGGRYNQRIVISRNTWGPGLGVWDVNIGPQTPGSGNDERLRDVLVESNFFTANSTTTVHNNIWASEVTSRNNVFLMNKVSGNITATNFSRRADEPFPHDNQYYGNTFYSSDASGRKTATGAQLGVDLVSNNLMYVPSATPALGVPTTLGNTIAIVNPFVSGTPTAPTDFDLDPASAPVAVGDFVTQNGVDYLGRARPPCATHDIGAFQISGRGDDDADGFVDGCDNCIEVSNPGQSDQTPPVGDGFGDACDGDFTGDNVVAGDDFAIFRGCFAAVSFGNPGFNAECDHTSDGIIGGGDFTIFRAELAKGCPGPSGFVKSVSCSQTLNAESRTNHLHIEPL